MCIGIVGSTATAVRDCGAGPLITAILLMPLGEDPVVPVREDGRAGKMLLARLVSDTSIWNRPIKFVVSVIAVSGMPLVNSSFSAIIGAGGGAGCWVWRSTENTNVSRVLIAMRKETGVDTPVPSEVTCRVWMSPTVPKPLSALSNILG